MSAVGTNIRRYREALGLTQNELAQKLNIARSTVTQWENGWSNPRMGMVQKLAGVFGVSTSDIVAEDADIHTLPDNAITPKPSTATAPVVGWVHAGAPEEERVADEIAELPSEVARNHPSGFFLRVEGDCMDRRFPEGCYVLVDPNLPPWNGCAVAAELPGYEGVLRAYYRGNSSLMLAADSFAEYEDIIITGDEPVRLIGVVVWFQAAREFTAI